MERAIIKKGAKIYDCVIAPDTIVEGDVRVNEEKDGIVLYAKGRIYR